MTLIDFTQKLDKIEQRSAVLATLYDFIDSHTRETELSEVKSYIEQLPEDRFTSFGSKLGLCKNCCIDQTQKAGSDKDENYLHKVTDTLRLLQELSSVYQSVNSERMKKQKISNESEASSQNEDVTNELNARVVDFRKELDQANLKIDNFKKEIDQANLKIDSSINTIDNKIFSLLINTVSILGIFVAIAFAGFGITSLFSNLDFSYAFQSRENTLNMIFFLLLVALLSYNLLLLLVYFIFKLSRPIHTNNSEEEKVANARFLKSMNLKSFFIVDAILLIIVVVFFFAFI